MIGSSTGLAYTRTRTGGTITRQAASTTWTTARRNRCASGRRTGRRPVLAAGNSNGDIEMLDYAQHQDKPYLRLFVLHDDPEREFDYVSRRGASA